MRLLQKNKQTLYYALYSSKTMATDANGLKTGEVVETYASPVEMSANISPARGSAELEMFGINTNYSKTIATGEMNCPISETSRIWIGVTPNLAANNWNYEVVGVAKSLNSIVYAVKEVDVS